MLSRDTNTAAHKTRTRHVTPSPTRERQERIAALVAALRLRQMTRDEIGALLHVGPSGVRKYLADLRGKVEPIVIDGQTHYRSTMSSEAAQAYLASLAPPARPVPEHRTTLSFAMRDPSRHFHIMEDDEHHQVRLLRKIPALDPITAHLFDRVPAGVWV